MGNDNINHPTYYTQGGVECIEAIKSATVGLECIQAVCTANAIKYIWRWKRKGGAEDIDKAIWYLLRLKQELGGTAVPAREASGSESVKFAGNRGHEKEVIWTRMKAYRKSHGLGCWKDVARLAGKDVTEDLLRDMHNGAKSPPLTVWRKVDKALERLEARADDPPAAPEGGEVRADG